MPACIDCVKFDPSGPRCTVEAWSPIRKCIIALLEQHLSDLRGATVCEVGCGPWPLAKEIVESNGCKWLGIDPVEYAANGRKTIRTHAGTVDEIPLPDDSVDVVLATQTLEHWHQYHTRFRWGFGEMHRILKPGGRLLMNFPIHLHGHRMFVRGDMKRIRSLWSPALWSDVSFEEWRKEFQPLEQYRGWQKSSTSVRLIPDPEFASSWVLDVTARKRSHSSDGLPVPGLKERVSESLIDMAATSIWPVWTWLTLRARRSVRVLPGFRVVRDLVKGKADSPES